MCNVICENDVHKFIMLRKTFHPHINIGAELDESSEAHSPRLRRGDSIISPINFEGFTLQAVSSIYSRIENLLSRRHSQRTHAEQRKMAQFIKENSAFMELYEVNGLDFCRGIMRQAKLVQFDEQQIIAEKGNTVDTVYLILEGRLATLTNEDESDMIDQLDLYQTYELLTIAAEKEFKRIKAKKNNQTPSMVYLKVNDNMPDFVRQEEIRGRILEEFEQGQTFGDRTRCRGKEHQHTTVALTQTVALAFESMNVLYWLHFLFEAKLEQSRKVMQLHPCFSELDHEFFEELARIMKVHRVSKGGLVYEQGLPASHFFFLRDGQFAIQKQGTLCSDNPNQLYVDRRKLMSNKELSNHEFLPYANLEHLYNYKPKTKVFKLGVLTPPCLFGEEELVSGRKRQTSVRCVSLRGVYLSFQMKRVLQILGDASNLFVDRLRQSLHDRMMYRQNAYSATINFSNTKELDCFYQDQQHQTLKTDRNSLVKKINKKILASQVKTRAASTQNISPSLGLNPQCAMHRQEIPPSFNSFNFHQMARIKYLNSSKGQRKSNFDSKNILKRPKKRTEIKEEIDIVEKSHTWDMVHEVVKQQSKQCQKIGSLKHKRNFTTPLIDEKAVMRVQKTMRRLDREEKSVSIRVKSWRSRETSLNSSAT